MTEAAHGVFIDAADRYGTEVGELHFTKRLEDDANLSFRLPGSWTPPVGGDRVTSRRGWRRSVAAVSR